MVGTEACKTVKLYKYLGVEIDNLLTKKQQAYEIIIKLGSHKPFMLRHVK